MLRGNVDTRLGKLAAGEADAILLAVSGLNRLGFDDVIRERLSLDDFPPAPGQGALAIQTRAEDARRRLGRGAERSDDRPGRRRRARGDDGAGRLLPHRHRRPRRDRGRPPAADHRDAGPDGSARWRRAGEIGDVDGADAMDAGPRPGPALGAEVQAEAGDQRSPS